MSLEKVLHKLQSQIGDLLTSLPNFTDETVQPSVNDCIELQKHLIEVQEYLAIYKYNKLNKEISPSFNIHAKLNEIEKNLATNLNQQSDKIDILQANELKIEVTPELKEVIAESVIAEPKNHFKPLSIAINDKFRFINELFTHNADEYAIAIEQINNLHNYQECEIYLNSLKSLYEWKEQSESVKQFYSLVKKRFE